MVGRTKRESVDYFPDKIQGCESAVHGMATQFDGLLLWKQSERRQSARAATLRPDLGPATLEAAGSWSLMLGDDPAVQRNGVRLQTGMAVAFVRIPHSIPRFYRIRVGSHSVDQKADRVPPRPQRESCYGL
jgi:hypothetical protein